MVGVEKLCPVVLRPSATGQDILAFRHPLAGVQLVKGTRQNNETIEAGTLRELAEESGIITARGTSALGSSEVIAPGELWHFVRVETDLLPERWRFNTLDDGGHVFDFFWFDLTATPGAHWHDIFFRALGHIRTALR